MVVVSLFLTCLITWVVTAFVKVPAGRVRFQAVRGEGLSEFRVWIRAPRGSLCKEDERKKRELKFGGLIMLGCYIQGSGNLQNDFRFKWQVFINNRSKTD